MSTHTITLPWSAPPLSMNQRQHWAEKARKTKATRRIMHILAARNKLPKRAGHATVQLCYLPRDNRRRDTDNLIATLKPLCDGLVDYGLVEDDTPAFMAKPEPIIHKRLPGDQPRLWVEITIREE